MQEELSKLESEKEKLIKQIEQIKERICDIKNEMGEIKRKATAERQKQKYEKKRKPFMMQVAKEKELRSYIKAIRISVAGELRSRGFSRKEISNILGVGYSCILDGGYSVLRKAYREATKSKDEDEI